MGSDRVVMVDDDGKDRSTRDRRRERDGATDSSNGRSRAAAQDGKDDVEVIDAPAGETAAASEPVANGEVKKKDSKNEEKKSTEKEKPRLKPPPTGKTTDKTVKSSTGSISEDTITTVAQAKFDAQEQNLQAVAKLTMAIARDYPKMTGDRTKLSEKFKEIKLAFLKYRRQLRVWKMQETVSQLNVKHLEKTQETYLANSETLFAKRAGLREELDEARVKRQKLEAHEAIAKEINQKKSCAESRAELEAAEGKVAEVQKDRVQLEATMEGQMKKTQLLMHAILDLKLELQRDVTASGLEDAGDADGQADATASTAADLDGKVVAEVIC